MFYKQFSVILDKLNPEFIKEFDFWLATLPKHKQKNITASVVSSQLEVSYSLAKIVLDLCVQNGILKKEFLIKCPVCSTILEKVEDVNDIEGILSSCGIECDECNEMMQITPDSIYNCYAVIKAPDVSDAEIEEAIVRRLETNTDVNFSQADSLSNDKQTLYQVYYNPSDSAYEKFKAMRQDLDKDYGKNTTAKGNALEELVLKIFNEIKIVSGTTTIKTATNQFDCTFQCGIKATYLSIFDLLTPYFIIECKNENKKPNNTYMNKLQSIIDTNDAKLGIIFARKAATSTCFQISREHYLVTKQSERKIIITCSDEDLDYIIDKRVNLLSYIEFKTNQITLNSSKSKYEDFVKEI